MSHVPLYPGLPTIGLYLKETILNRNKNLIQDVYVIGEKGEK